MISVNWASLNASRLAELKKDLKSISLNIFLFTLHFFMNSQAFKREKTKLPEIDSFDFTCSNPIKFCASYSRCIQMHNIVIVMGDGNITCCLVAFRIIIIERFYILFIFHSAFHCLLIFLIGCMFESTENEKVQLIARILRFTKNYIRLWIMG